jgi:hypothetical protein
MLEQESPDLRKPRTNHDPRPETDGLITQRLALLAVFAVAVIAVLTFAYVL